MTDSPENNVPDAPAKNPAPKLRTELRSELRNWCEAWKTCLQNVLSQVSGQPAAFEISSQPVPAGDSDFWYTVVAGGAVHGEMTLRLPAASGTRLAQKFLSEAEPAAEGITPEHKEALEELLRQIAGLAATALAPTAGGEVQFHLSASAAPSWSSDAIACLHTRDEAGTPITIEIQISPALAAELQSRVQPAPPAQTSPRPSPQPPPQPPAQPSPPPSIQPPPSHGCRPRRQTPLRNPPYAAPRCARPQCWSRRRTRQRSPFARRSAPRRTPHRPGRSRHRRRQIRIAYHRRRRFRTCRRIARLIFCSCGDGALPRPSQAQLGSCLVTATLNSPQGGLHHAKLL